MVFILTPSQIWARDGDGVHLEGVVRYQLGGSSNTRLSL